MPLQNLRSSAANKRPTPGAMSDGQIALNTQSDSPGVFFKDGNGDLVKVGPVHVGPTAPNATPAAGGQTGNSKGELWLDTASSRYVFKIWDGTAWRTEDGEFVNSSGDTMTGALVMDNQQPVRFREATANGTNFIALQASAAVASDKTITLPDITGTVVTTGDTGSVTSAMIASGTIVDGDISASAVIAHSKLANITAANVLLGNASNVPTATAITGDITISNTGVTAIASGVIVDADVATGAEIAVSKLGNGTARQLLQTDTAGTGVEWATNIDVPGTLDVTGATVLDGALTANGNVTLNAQADLRFADADSSNWVAFQAPATVASNVTWTLPSTDGTSAQVLQTNGSGVLSWASSSGGGDVFLASNNAFTGSNTFASASGQTFFDTTSTRDGVIIKGSTTGSSSRRVTIGPASLTTSRTLTLPDTSGTVVTTGDTGTVTSTMIFNGTIINEDINASAAIVDTKLATISTAGKVSGTAITSGNTSTSGSFTTTSTVTAASLIPTGSTVPTNGVYLPAANTTAIATNSTERIRFSSTGLVGIGTNSPSQNLHLNSSSNTLLLISSTLSGSTSTGVRIDTTGDSSVGSLSFLKAGVSRGDISYRHNATGSSERLSVNVSGTEHLSVLGSGSVGVGTTSPGERLHIAGTGQKILTTPVAYAGSQDSAYLIAAASSYTGATTNWGTYGMQHRVKSNAGGTFRVTVDSSFGEQFSVHENSFVVVGSIASPANQFQVSTDSAGKPSTNTWTIVSDERIKEDIEPANLDLCYEAVKSIPLKRFAWKPEVYTEEQVKDRHKIGWIAQDVETVFPKAVNIHKFVYNQVFEEGELISEDVIEDCRNLNSDQIYAAMYGAIQKLINKVESLEAQFAALEA